MAPERLQGATPDPRADVYALGVILYELTCGKRPFSTLHGLALAAVLVQTSSDGWDYPDSLDMRVIALIRAMTARQPEQRIESMDEVARRLAELGGDHAFESTNTASHDWRAMSRRTKLVCVASLSAALLGSAWWQGVPYLRTLRSSVQKALVPYSEAASMERGLAALKLFDRPGSLVDAQLDFEQILARTPENAAAVAGISLVYNMRYGNDSQDETWLQKAVASAQQALKLNDQLALSHVANGAAQESRGAL